MEKRTLHVIDSSGLSEAAALPDSGCIVVPGDAVARKVRGFAREVVVASSILEATTHRSLTLEASDLFDVWGAQCPLFSSDLDYRGVSLWTVLENRVVRDEGLFAALRYRAIAHELMVRYEPDVVHLYGQPDATFIAAFVQASRADVRLRWHVPPLSVPRLLHSVARRVVRLVRQRRAALATVPHLSLTTAKRVVFLLYTSRHVAALRAIVEQLPEELDSLFVSMGVDAARALQQSGLSGYSLQAFMLPESHHRLRRARSHLEKVWQALQEESMHQRCLRDEEGELWPLLQGKLATLFETTPGGGRLFAERFVEAAHYVELSHALVNATNPDLLVVFNELNVLGRAAVLTANAREVRTLHVQHGFMAYWALWRKLYANKITVWGEANRRNLEAAGIAPNRIVVTGNPSFDRFVAPVPPEDVAAVRAQLGIGAEVPILLTTTQPDDEEATRQQLAAVIGMASSFPDYRIVIKIHPGEQLETYRKLLAEFDNKRVFLTRDLNLFSLLAASAVLITRSSTTGLEAMVLGKPVITLNFSGQPDMVPYAAEGAALGVYEPSALHDALQRVLHDRRTQQELARAQEQFVRNYAYQIDGHAAARVAEQIVEMVRR